MRRTAAMLLFALIVLSPVAYVAGQMTSGYYVVPSEYLDPEQRSYLENRIKTTISNAGLMVTDDYFPMVTAIQYNHIETIVVEGIRRSYKTDGEVTVVVLFDETNTVLASRSFPVSGIGTSTAIAQANAIRKISIPIQVLKEFYASAASNYESAVNAFSEKQYRRGKELQGMGELSDAIAVLSTIPESTKQYASAQKLIDQASRQRQQREEAETQRAERERERQHELQKTTIQEVGKTQRQIVRSSAEVAVERTRVNERYHSLWLSIMAGR